jgi:hypothetical protein
VESELLEGIKGYEGKYQISNYGRVWSVKRQIYLKPKTTRDGYYAVCLVAKNGKLKHERIHRLVALMFCPKEKDKIVVNHLDGNKKNNYYKNLEWCTVKENTIHAYKNDLGNFKENLKMATQKARNKVSHTIIVYQNGVFIGKFVGKEKCAEFLNISPKTIYNYIHGKCSNRKGYSFVKAGGDVRCNH